LPDHTYRHNPHLLSFPTRRSSDLDASNASAASLSAAQQQNQRAAFIAAYPYNIAPVSDSAPFFFFTFKTPRLLQGIIHPGKVGIDRKSTRLNSSHVAISYAVFCLK